jgi:hypothetical protein
MYGIEGEALARNKLMVEVTRLALLLGVFGAATTWVAMEYYFFTFDLCGAWAKMFWFLVMCFVPIGTALYCFRVYSRSKYFQPDSNDQSKSFSMGARS